MEKQIIIKQFKFNFVWLTKENERERDEVEGWINYLKVDSAKSLIDIDLTNLIQFHLKNHTWWKLSIIISQTNKMAILENFSFPNL